MREKTYKNSQRNTEGEVFRRWERQKCLSDSLIHRKATISTRIEAGAVEQTRNYKNIWNVMYDKIRYLQSLEPKLCWNNLESHLERDKTVSLTHAIQKKKKSKK